MPLTLEQLLAEQTSDEILAELLAGIPSTWNATAWQEGSVPLTLLDGDAVVLSSLTRKLVAITKGGYLEKAEGDWLALYTESAYQETRKPAVVTKGKVRFSCASGSGPHTVTPSSPLTVATAGGLLYRTSNAANAVIPSNGFVDIDVTAESPGSAYNVANGSISILKTPLAGVTVSNPAIGATGTWTTQSGSDTESDVQLRARCKAKWSTLGTGASADAYKSWALSASSEVRRVKATGSSGVVTVTVAGETGLVSSQALTDVQTYIEARRPLAVQVLYQHATIQNQTYTGTVTVQSAFLASAPAAVEDAITAYEKTLEIGGNAPTNAIVLSEVIAAALSVDGVVDCSISSPTGNVAIGATSIANIVTSLTYVGI